jgi:hypothetical protein
MKKRFIVCHNPGSLIEDQAFKKWLNDQRLGWWHWMSGSWLVIDKNGAFTATQIRDAFKGIYNKKLCMVFEHGSDDYAGIGPDDDDKREQMSSWLEKNWNVWS